MEEDWRKLGGGLEDHWRAGGGSEEDRRSTGGALEEDGPGKYCIVPPRLGIMCRRRGGRFPFSARTGFGFLLATAAGNTISHL